MTKQDAHETLNLARIGGNVSVQDINEALRATGDLGGHHQSEAKPPQKVAAQAWPWYATETGEQVAA